jgi:DNA-binding response OmpR family regulator
LGNGRDRPERRILRWRRWPATGAESMLWGGGGRFTPPRKWPMRNILIVDVPTPFRDAVALTLGRRGFDVRVVDTIAEAAAEMLTDPVDLVLLDPGRVRNGRVAISDTSAPWMRHTPVILLTTEPELPRDTGLDVRGVLVKSRFTLAELAGAVHRVLRSYDGTMSPAAAAAA